MAAARCRQEKEWPSSAEAAAGKRVASGEQEGRRSDWRQVQWGVASGEWRARSGEKRPVASAVASGEPDEKRA